MKTTIGIAIGLLFAAFTLTGCGPTGWASKPLEDGSKLNPGDRVTIVQRDGEQTTGKFVGVSTMELPEYAARYNDVVLGKGLDSSLPIIGEEVQLTTRLSEKRIISGRLIGFDEVNLWLESDHQAEPLKIFVASITGFSHGGGGFLSQREFRSLFLNGAIPLRNAVMVRSNGADTLIPVDAIKRIQPVTGGASSAPSISSLAQ